MILAKDVTKTFDGVPALKAISCTIPEGCVWGMVGSNGAGKSTFLRLISGVYRPDSGEVTLDGAPIRENPAAKARICYVPDEVYFLPSSNIDRMAKLYGAAYARFDTALLKTLADKLELSLSAPISTFSKGMKRQAATILALAAHPDYYLFDETFDGLDPVMRAYVKNLICEDVLSRGACAVITSHSLRELEDTCDQLALLHKGGLVLQSETDQLKTSKFKIQIAFAEPFDRSRFTALSPIHYVQHGSVASFLVSGEKDEILNRLQTENPILLEVLPLSLEEIFTYEMEALGYHPDAQSPEERGL